MFGLLLRAAKAAVKGVARQVVKQAKYAVKVAKNPIKAVKNSFKFKKKSRSINKGVKKAIAKNAVLKDFIEKPAKLTNDVSKPTSSKKTGSAEPVTDNSKRIEKIANIVQKADLLENMLNDMSEVLRGKSSAKVIVNSYIKDINDNKDILQVKSDSDLNKLENMLNKELKDLNVDTDSIDSYFKDNSKYFDTVKLNSFETYMDNWKSKFFDSDTTEHLSEDEKKNIWGEIEESRTFSWFADRKAT